MADESQRKPMTTLGMSMRRFGQSLMRHYQPSEKAAEARRTQPPPYQSMAQAPIEWEQVLAPKQAPMMQQAPEFDAQTPDMPYQQTRQPAAPPPQQRQQPIQRQAQQQQQKPAAPPQQKGKKLDSRLRAILDLHKGKEEERTLQRKERQQKWVEAQNQSQADSAADKPKRKRPRPTFEYLDTSSLSQESERRSGNTPQPKRQDEELQRKEDDKPKIRSEVVELTPHRAEPEPQPEPIVDDGFIAEFEPSEDDFTDDDFVTDADLAPLNLGNDEDTLPARTYSPPSDMPNRAPSAQNIQRSPETSIPSIESASQSSDDTYATQSDSSYGDDYSETPDNDVPFQDDFSDVAAPTQATSFTENTPIQRTPLDAPDNNRKSDTPRKASQPEQRTTPSESIQRQSTQQSPSFDPDTSDSDGDAPFRAINDAPSVDQQAPIQRQADFPADNQARRFDAPADIAPSQSAQNTPIQRMPEQYQSEDSDFGDDAPHYDDYGDNAPGDSPMMDSYSAPSSEPIQRQHDVGDDATDYGENLAQYQQQSFAEQNVPPTAEYQNNPSTPSAQNTPIQRQSEPNQPPADTAQYIQRTMDADGNFQYSIAEDTPEPPQQQAQDLFQAMQNPDTPSQGKSREHQAARQAPPQKPSQSPEQIVQRTMSDDGNFQYSTSDDSNTPLPQQSPEQIVQRTMSDDGNFQYSTSDDSNAPLPQQSQNLFEAMRDAGIVSDEGADYQADYQTFESAPSSQPADSTAPTGQRTVQRRMDNNGQLHTSESNADAAPLPQQPMDVYQALMAAGAISPSDQDAPDSTPIQRQATPRKEVPKDIQNAMLQRMREKNEEVIRQRERQEQQQRANQSQQAAPAQDTAPPPPGTYEAIVQRKPPVTNPSPPSSASVVNDEVAEASVPEIDPQKLANDVYKEIRQRIRDEIERQNRN